jgi:hypothetical protein
LTKQSKAKKILGHRQFKIRKSSSPLAAVGVTVRAEGDVEKKRTIVIMNADTSQIAILLFEADTNKTVMSNIRS